MKQIEKNIASFVALGKPIAKLDNFRPDVRVEVISAKIDSIDESKQSKNIVFSVEGQQYKHNGYIGSNELVYKLIEEAKKLNRPVIVRLERKRKSKIDPKLKIMDLTKDMDTARENAVKTTVGIYDVNNHNWILTSEAESNPDEDPKEVMRGIKSVNYNPKNFFSENHEQNQNIPQVPKNREMSAKADNLVTLFFFIREKENKAGITLTNKQREEYVNILAASCNFIQTRLFKLKKPVYSDYSYTRTRYLLFNYEEHVSPFTAESFKDANSMKNWAREFIGTGAKIWEWAIKKTQEN